MNACTAIAHANIALIKYWGKRDASLNLPAVGSISLTLEGLTTTTRVEFLPGAGDDVLTLNGAPAAEGARLRASRFLSRIRALTGTNDRAVVHSTNDFPTGAGLASSASAFAALALAGSRAAGLDLSSRALGILARQGSGSAPRSLFGGFVEMHRGSRADGDDAYAEPLLAPDVWPLTVLVAVTSEHEKATGSTSGMSSSAATSPYHQAWIDQQPSDLAAMREAIASRDFARVGELTEASCFKMHADMLATRPALLYWKPATIAAIDAVRDLRASGVPAYVTIDAGPQVKVLTLPFHAERVREHLQHVPGVLRVLTTGLGGAARVLP